MLARHTIIDAEGNESQCGGHGKCQLCNEELAVKLQSPERINRWVFGDDKEKNDANS